MGDEGRSHERLQMEAPRAISQQSEYAVNHLRQVLEGSLSEMVWPFVESKDVQGVRTTANTWNVSCKNGTHGELFFFLVKRRTESAIWVLSRHAVRDVRFYVNLRIRRKCQQDAGHSSLTVMCIGRTDICPFGCWRQAMQVDTKMGAVE